MEWEKALGLFLGSQQRGGGKVVRRHETAYEGATVVWSLSPGFQHSFVLGARRALFAVVVVDDGNGW